METISGASNWKLTIQREPEGITILRAVTCDAEAVLPEMLFGQPVTALGSHALAAGVRETKGEAVTVTGAPCAAAWDNRGIQRLTLPRTLLRVGNYAFFNCEGMQALTLYDNIQKWGGSVFMNCRALGTFRLARETAAQGETLAYLCDVLPCELDITVTEADGRTLRLLFPEYIETYEENAPAHHFDLHIFGTGYPYHHCFTRKRLELPRYDRLWTDFLFMEHEEETALRIAWYRLRYPVELGEEAKAQYLAYLRGHAAEALHWRLSKRDGDGLRWLLHRISAPRSLLTELCTAAREQGDTQSVALLLEEQRRAGIAEKSFAL